MTLPHLPDDALIEILSHVFGSKTISTPSSPTTPLKGSTSLLLTSKRFLLLALPFFWRSLTLIQPSDFPLFFNPKTGLLTIDGEVGDRRRGWVKELCFGEDAAPPYDLTAINEAFDDGFEPSFEDPDFLFSLFPILLPNLRHVCLGESGYLVPYGLEERSCDDEPSYRLLIRRLEEVWTQEVLADGGNPYEGDGISIDEILLEHYSSFWQKMAEQSQQLIGQLLEPHADQLDTLEFSAPPRSPGSIVPPITADPRLPGSLLDSGRNLVVTLHLAKTSRHLEVARSLSRSFSKHTQVRVVGTWSCTVGQVSKEAREAPREDRERWENWSWVANDGTSTSFVAKYTA